MRFIEDLDLLTNRLAIEDFFARYANTADTYDADSWVDCFAEGGTFEVEADGGGIQFVGRENLNEFICTHIR
ncbi:MAG: nuclear transport factor 2 family protein, partial [Pseudomonadales bacterium]